MDHTVEGHQRCQQDQMLYAVGTPGRRDTSIQDGCPSVRCRPARKAIALTAYCTTPASAHANRCSRLPRAKTSVIGTGTWSFASTHAPSTSRSGAVAPAGLGRAVTHWRTSPERHSIRPASHLECIDIPGAKARYESVIQPVKYAWRFIYIPPVQTACHICQNRAPKLKIESVQTHLDRDKVR